MPERRYEIRVAGLVQDEEILEAIPDVEVAEHEFMTVLSGRFLDQAELYGLLNRLRSFGLEVVEVRRASTAGPTRATPDGDAG